MEEIQSTPNTETSTNTNKRGRKKLYTDEERMNLKRQRAIAYYYKNKEVCLKKSNEWSTNNKDKKRNACLKRTECAKKFKMLMNHDKSIIEKISNLSKDSFLFLIKQIDVLNGTSNSESSPNPAVVSDNSVGGQQI